MHQGQTSNQPIEDLDPPPTFPQKHDPLPTLSVQHIIS